MPDAGGSQPRRALAGWLQREWSTASLRGLRIQASAQAAAAQPPIATDIWAYGQQVEVVLNFDKTPVWLKVRYIQRSGCTNSVELLRQTEDDVTQVSDGALRRMPPWPPTVWASRMVKGDEIEAPHHGGFTSARITKVDQN